ncbi:MAG: hypothetical protein QOD77_1134 [Thermoplasmata archaeon]|jgi:uncharacterized protein YecE (DUF72 family)|nr:hypothetical protein [Thermoplasmata archaeon]
MAEAFIGTSGWSYADWKGDFYPKGLPSNQWLRHFAQQFPTVELNASFYRMPAPATVRAWSRKVPEGFRFAAKLWRGITHYRQLANYEDQLAHYVEVVRNFPLAQRGPILVQLPPQMPVHLRRLEAFLHDLKQRTRRLRFPLAVEFRHASWITRSVWDLLDSMDVAVVVHDMARAAPVPAPNDASFVYVRRHGPKPRYHGSYTTGQLQHDAALVRAWLAEGRDVYLYFNNDRQGNAHRNAKELLAILEKRGVARPPRPPSQRGFTNSSTPLPANPTPMAATR